MARPIRNNRDLLLDAAEAVITQSGAAALSFASLAAMAGLPKASVQSAFGTRAALMDALLDRWMHQETARYRSALGEGASSAEARLLAHLRCTLEELQGDRGQRVATLLAILTGEGQQSDSLRRWYRDRLGDLEAQDPEARRRRIAYLAAEGAFFLRCLVGIDADPAIWDSVFDDLGQL